MFSTTTVRRLGAVLASSLAIAGAGASSAQAADFVSDWDHADNWAFNYYSSWGYLTSSASAWIAWTHPNGKSTGEITTGTAWSRSTWTGGCVRVKVTAYYANFGWKSVAPGSASDGFYTACSSYTTRMNLQGIKVSGWTLMGMNVMTCWSRTASSAPINCSDETLWDGGL
ncbi:MAG: hypothetical protein QOD86_692 [Miltoncostaeaceae bacterium]|jgi:hypothetical protein|nr:hypothetical protein [Miltoncostaeaceae bacterium]